MCMGFVYEALCATTKYNASTFRTFLALFVYKIPLRNISQINQNKNVKFILHDESTYQTFCETNGI